MPQSVVYCFAYYNRSHQPTLTRSFLVAVKPFESSFKWAHFGMGGGTLTLIDLQ